MTEDKNDKLWGDEATVNAIPEKECLACGNMYQPTTSWSERCSTCKALNKPKLKKIINTEFNGIAPPPKSTHRIYEIGKKKYPSVTSIIHPEGIDYPKDLLEQYGWRGTIVHHQIEMFLRFGVKFKTMDELMGSHYATEEIVEAGNKLRKGSLGLKTEDCNFYGFHEEFGEMFEYKKIELRLKNRKHVYAGRTDAIGAYKNSLSIIDFKTSSVYDDSKLEDYFMQLAAYSQCDEVIKKFGKVTSLVVIPLSPRSPNGYLPPIVSKKVKHYFDKFLKKREIYKIIYKI